MKIQDGIIEKSLLQKTNTFWNRSQVNHPWSIGYTSYLIIEQSFSNFDDWVCHYFNTGDKRDILIDLIAENDKRILLRMPDAPKIEFQKFKLIDQSSKKLNLEYGRSWEAIEKRVIFFQKFLSANNVNLQYEDCAKLFLQRVIIDTWNGRARERNTISNLESKYPEFQFQDSNAWSDFNYGIDFNVLKEGRLIAALQIKPISYRGNKKYISAAKKANKIKWKQFEKEKGVNVFLILSNEEGDIQEENGLYQYLKDHQ